MQQKGICTISLYSIKITKKEKEAMEKKVFEWKVPENELLDVGGYKIEVMPYIPLSEQVRIINEYVMAYFHPDKKFIIEDECDSYTAEYALKLALLDICTNIKLEGDFENVLYLNIYEQVEMSITNYYEFRNALDSIVANIKEQRLKNSSVGLVIDSIYQKINVLISELGENIKNFKPEDLEKLKEVGNSLVEKINESPLVQAVFEDAAKSK